MVITKPPLYVSQIVRSNWLYDFSQDTGRNAPCCLSVYLAADKLGTVSGFRPRCKIALRWPSIFPFQPAQIGSGKFIHYLRFYILVALLAEATQPDQLNPELITLSHYWASSNWGTGLEPRKQNIYPLRHLSFQPGLAAECLSDRSSRSLPFHISIAPMMVIVQTISLLLSNP